MRHLAESPTVLYARGVTDQRWDDDPAQRAVLPSLDCIRAGVMASRSSGCRRWLPVHSRRVVRGLYLWGAVGRGKTLLADLLVESLPPDLVLRLHFHRCMGRVQAQLKTLQGRVDPLREVAAAFAAEAKLLCLDEFFVSDIGDAMILAGLLEHLFAHGVTLVTTSNIEPAGLYRDGLQRARFLPAIALLEAHCEVRELVSPRDYRLRALTRAGVYFTPAGVRAEHELAACFARIAAGTPRPDTAIRINDRDIPIHRRGDGAVWFDFAALCEGPRSVADYIDLAQRFNTVLISNVPQFTPQMEDAARRFVDLVDEFYDRGVKLVLSAAAPATELYDGERLRAEFARTESRLIEMQSAQYLAAAHRH
ncbi:MAG: AFG1 family ATPase [Proteobacteria bacterium]|nr:AFG1 family ATPase [Pseudomonadota bacterium]